MKISNNKVIGIVVLALVVLGVLCFYVNTPSKKDVVSKPKTTTEAYNPVINPADFTTVITNKYFSLPVGKKLLFDAESDKGKEKIQIEITGETKIIEGVKTLVYTDTVYLGGQIHEITRDYLAQNIKTGDVWYFGEEVDNYENGKIKDHAGTFIHGKDGAKAGIWMKAEQRVGDSYQQEYYKGEAEDMRDTVEVGIVVKTKLGTFNDCVKVYDWTPLDPKSREHKYYCPSIGALVLNENLETGKRSELTKVTP